MNRPGIKICGLTDPALAVQCAEAGADTIGLVFFEKSPRNVSITKAAEIASALPPGTVATGVFVNESFDFILERAEICGLSAVQLHGSEPPELINRLKAKGLKVIKALYLESSPGTDLIDNYKEADAFLVECAKGILPGGNALSWNFARVRNLKTEKPLIIAGGLSPSNITEAMNASQADMADVSSGVENEPGIKDINKVRAFIKNVYASAYTKHIRRLF